MERNKLTLEYAQSNIGNKIEWFCTGYSANNAYYGVCEIKGIAKDLKDRDVLMVNHISGDNLAYGWFEDGYLNYSDSGRAVYLGKAFDSYTLLWEVGVNTWDNPIEYSIVRWLDDARTLGDLIASITTVNIVKIRENGQVWQREGKTFLLLNDTQKYEVNITGSGTAKEIVQELTEYIANLNKWIKEGEGYISGEQENACLFISILEINK